MRYLARVTVVFSDNGKGSNASDIWEATLAVDSESARQALAQAISKSRTVLDDLENWRALGYSKKPYLYAIRSLHTEVEFPGRKASCNSDCMMLTMIGTFDENQVAKLVAFEDVLVPYCVMYIDSENGAAGTAA
jgi:hypothetical protein